MSQKYYHNDYKKLLGVDETRTASEKLLDRAIGGVRPPPESKSEKVPEKKVKEQHSSLTHSEVLTKIVKNLSVNSHAVKLVKPLNLLRKCLGDNSFILNPEINKLELWEDLLDQLIDIDERMIGNYGQILPTNEGLLQIFILLFPLISKFDQKVTAGDTKKEENQQIFKKEDENQLRATFSVDRCRMQIMYYKMFTDDNFAFNKTLLEFKKQFFQYFQDFLQGKSSQKSYSFLKYLSQLILKMFKLPFRKYQWIKSSLGQFFKEFNIQYKQLLPEDLLGKYLQKYNEFISQKGGHSGGEDVNIFGQSKGGKITQVVVVKDDGFDAWTSKQ